MAKLDTDDLRELWAEVMEYNVSPQDAITMILESPEINMGEFFLGGVDEDVLQAFARTISDHPTLNDRLSRMLDEDDGDLAIMLARYGLLCLTMGMTLGVTAGREVFSNA